MTVGHTSFSAGCTLTLMWSYSVVTLVTQVTLGKAKNIQYSSSGPFKPICRKPHRNEADYAVVQLQDMHAERACQNAKKKKKTSHHSGLNLNVGQSQISKSWELNLI